MYGRLRFSCFLAPLTRFVAERHTWNWHENYFDVDNCNFDELHLKDAFDALKINTMCVEDGGHNEGWALGHYDENRNDPAETNPFAFSMEPIKQIYEAEGKTYKVRINAFCQRDPNTHSHLVVHRCLLHLRCQPTRRPYRCSRHLQPS
jgi:hypothetical protein